MNRFMESRSASLRMNPLSAKLTLMKTTARSLFVFLIGITFSSCGMVAHSTRDPRFNQIFGREIQAKRPLRLYRIDRDLTGDTDHHYITAGYYPFSETDSGEIGVLPTGHPVRFEKLRRDYSIDGGSERLLGTTMFRGTTYLVSYYLGLAGDDTIAGWKRIYLSFEIPKP
jgi:hypothetical protein